MEKTVFPLRRNVIDTKQYGKLFLEHDVKRSEDDATMVIFDVVCIDLENRKVLFTRFGAGDDRGIEF